MNNILADCDFICAKNELLKDNNLSGLLEFKKDFYVNKQIVKAQIFASALGVYDCYINNKKTDNYLFKPGFVSYNKRLPYNVIDITKILKIGENSLKILVADGWYKGVFTYNNQTNIWGDTSAIICKIVIDFDDGTTLQIKSDNSFLCKINNQIQYSEFYKGEKVDFTKENDTVYSFSAQYNAYDKTKLYEYDGSYSVYHQEFLPKKIYKKEKSIIIDFGQNIAGVIICCIQGEYGQKIVIEHGEILLQNNLYRKNLRKADARLVYVLDDNKREIIPHFTYMGFRFIEIFGLNASTKYDFKAVSIYTDMSRVGFFECSDNKINQLYNAIIWGQRSNFIEVPTDCPQRDERMGYTGDAQVFSETACYNYNCDKFFTKWLRDCVLDQQDNGLIDNCIPFGKEIQQENTSSGWGDVIHILPLELYYHFGNKQILIECYPAIKKWVEYCLNKAAQGKFGSDRYIFDNGKHHLGDWLAYGYTPEECMAHKKWVSTAFMSLALKNTAKIAHILRLEQQEHFYLDLAKKVDDAYLEKFFVNGRITNGIVASYVLPLAFQMITGDIKVKFASILNDIVTQNNFKVMTGFVATKYLLQVLVDNGYAKTALKVLKNEECPSWLYQINHGATTMWERWDAIKNDGSVNEQSFGGDNMVSFNHYAYGSVGSFLYKYLGGIKPLKPGYKQIEFAPLINNTINNINCKISTLFGDASISWKLQDNQVTLKLKVPKNTKGFLKLKSYGGKNEILQSGSYIRNFTFTE